MADGGAMVYVLRILQYGACSGARKQTEDDELADAAVNEEALALMKERGAVVPGDVVRSARSKGVKLPPSGRLRMLVRRLRRRNLVTSHARKSTKKQSRPLTWTARFEAKVASLQEDDFIAVHDAQAGATVTRFRIAAVGLFKWLQRMHRESPFAHLVMQADHTFNLEWMGYVFGAVGAVVHRLVKGRWRRTFVPLVWVCSPRESKGSYKAAFETLRAQLEVHGLPAPTQLSCDHFGGIPKAFRNEFPRAKVSRWVWLGLQMVCAELARAELSRAELIRPN